MNPWKRRGMPTRGPEDPGLWGFLRVVCLIFLFNVYRYSARGGETLSAGGVVLAVSHKSWWDPIFAAMAFNRPLRYMAKAELFEHRGSRWLVTTLGAYPVRRGESDVQSLRRSLEILAEGGVLGMFPEGHRFHDDVIHPFHAGISLLAARSGCPVVPVAIRGTKVMARHKLPRFPRVRVAVGAPVDVSDIEGRGGERHAAAAERVRLAVEQLYESL